MRAGALLASTLGILTLGAGGVGAEPVTVSGRTVAAASTVSQASSGEILTATIPRGKRHTILSIDAGLDGYLDGGGYIIVSVNDLSFGVVQPSFTADAVCRASGSPPICTISGQFWVDVDASEASAPGTFVGQPIDVDLYVNVSAVPGYQYFASLRVRMDKK